MSTISKTWKPVKASKLYDSGKRGFASNDSSKIEKMMILSGNRKQLLKTYDQMDEVSVDVSRALDIIAEDISSDGITSQKMFELCHPEEVNVSSASLKAANVMLTKWIKQTELEYTFFDLCREMVKYGAVFMLKEKEGKLKKLTASRIEGYKVSEKDENEVTHYVYNEKMKVKNEHDDSVGGKDNKNGQQKDEKILIPKNKLLILKMGDSPLGRSILRNVYRPWRQLQLLEDAVVIYRIIRAPERRIFYIDVGRMSPAKSEAYVEKIKRKMHQKQVTKTSKIDTNYNPMSMQEDYFIAQSGEGRGSRVEQMAGGANLGEVNDVNYFKTQLSLGLRIPPSYLDQFEDSKDGTTYNDGRVGTAYLAEMRYAGYIKRIQRNCERPLRVNFVEYATENSVEIDENLDLKILDPQSFEEYRQAEIDSSLLNNFGQADGIEAMSKEFSMKKFLKMDQTELDENTRLMLLAKGFSDKEQKTLSDEVKSNIVYGDGSLNPKAPEEKESEDDSGGGFGFK